MGKYTAIVRSGTKCYYAIVKRNADGKIMFQQQHTTEQTALSVANAELEKLKREDERKAP